MLNRICKFYTRGVCLKGEQCDFGHEENDDICRYYQEGFCAYGSRCRYKHIIPFRGSSSTNGSHSPTKGTLSWVPKVIQSSSSDNHTNSSQHKNLTPCGKDVGQSNTSDVMPSKLMFCIFGAANCPLQDKCPHIHGNQCLYCRKFCLHPTNRKEKENHLRTCDKKEKYLQAMKHSQEIECNICLEHVLSKPKPTECKFGLLLECDHAFCLSCIRNWRNSAPTSGIEINNISNTVRTCPVCRKLSYFVIPSGIWYFTKEEKMEIIGNYKANCRLIDCKHFNFGNGNCPFGTSCFYKHTIKPGSYTYTWIPHKPPPPQHRQNDFDTFDTLDLLSDAVLSSAEYFSIMRDSEVFDDIDPFEMMDISRRSLNEPSPYLGHLDSDVESLDLFQMIALSEALLDLGSEDFKDEDFNSLEVVFNLNNDAF